MNHTTVTKTPRGESADLEAILDAFEEAVERTGTADLAAFLPDTDDPRYSEIAVELVRVDLERSQARGILKPIEQYREVVPLVFAEPRLLGEIAFEEYRLRRQRGELVELDEYARRFSVNTSHWPTLEYDPPDERSAGPSESNDAAPISSMLLQFPIVGENFADFELVEQLGRGAFGVVFQARQRDLAAREVALKITAARSLEPERLARLQHTNIVPIYSVHRERGLLAICMPFLGRTTLADFIGNSHQAKQQQLDWSTVVDRHAETLAAPRPSNAPVPIPSAEAARGNEVEQHFPPHENRPSFRVAVDLVTQLAEGLAHAHARGIIHSDLKPANVLLGDDGTARLLDFNLSDDTSTLRRFTLQVGGTLPYMAPEHLQAVLDGQPTRAESDIYSLGVIFFELLTGQRPFPPREASALDELLAAMIRDRRQGPPSAREFAPSLSPALAAIVAKCLVPNPDARYQAAADLAEDLRRHQADQPLKHAREPSVRERGAKWLRRNARGIRVAGIAALMLLLIAMTTLYVARRHRLADFEAAQTFADFQSDVLTASLNLNTPGTEPELEAIGRSAAKRALNLFPTDQHRRLADDPNFTRLTPIQQQEVRNQSARLSSWLAEPDVSGTTIPNPSAKAHAATQDAFLHGIELLETSQFAAAVPIWEQLSQDDRQNPVSWFLLGNAYVGVRRLADAESSYTAVIALQPRAVGGYYYRGMSRLEQGDFAAAEQDFTAVLELRPGLSSALINRALVWQALGAFQLAERDATTAIERGLDDPRAYFVRALIRDALGNAAGAKADRDRGFELTPKDDKGWIARGMAYLRSDPQRARDEFEAGLAEFPHSAALMRNSMHVLADRLRQPESALPIADQLVERFPSDPSTRASRAVLRARLGDRAGAHQDAERASKLAPPALTMLQLSCVYGLTSQAEPVDAQRALELLQAALARQPQLAARAEADPDLAALRSLPEFDSLIAAAVRLTSPP